MKIYSILSKYLELEPRHQMQLHKILVNGVVLSLFRGAVCIFYSPIRQDDLSAKMKDFRRRKNISRIFLEILLKSQTNQLKNLYMTNETLIIQKNRRRENLMIYFFDYA